MKYGRYQVVEEIGRGSMGVVYRAHDPQIDRLVALKVLRQDRVSSEDYVRRFLKEATAVGRLSHRGIVTVYDVGQDHGTIYIAMELLEGTPLDELRGTKTFTHQEISDLGRKVAASLHYAHSKGIVHRDIKPANIICSSDGEVKVTDFGIAHIDDPDGQQMTQAGEILGTPVYMSPEQVMGQTVDGRSDVYSLGVILYELCTGERPFAGKNLGALFKSITTDDVGKPSEVTPGVPDWLSDVVMKAMAREPAERFSSAGQLAEALVPPRQVAVAGKKEPTGRGHKLAPLLALVVVVCCLAGAYVFRDELGIGQPVDKLVEVVSSLKGQLTGEDGKSVPVSREEPSRDAAQETQVVSGEGAEPDGQELQEKTAAVEEEPVLPETPEEVPGEQQTTSSAGEIADTPDQVPKARPDAVETADMDDGELGEPELDDIFINKGVPTEQTRPEKYDEPGKTILTTGESRDQEKEQPGGEVREKEEPQEDISPQRVEMTGWPFNDPAAPEKSEAAQESTTIAQPVQAKRPQQQAIESAAGHVGTGRSTQDVVVIEKTQQKKRAQPEDTGQQTMEKTTVASLSPPKQEKKLALMNITSRPEGADVFVDGEYMGKTPFKKMLSAEPHEVRLELQGHANWQGKLNLSRDMKRPLSYRLLPE